MNPFAYPGPQFLVFYAVLLGVVLFVALLVRSLMRQPSSTLDEDLDETLHPYEIAYLAGGETAAIDACIVRLFRVGVLRNSSVRGQIEHTGRRLADDSHALEKATVAAVERDPNATIDKLRDILAPRAEKLRQRLVDKGLVVSYDDANRICMVSGGIVLSAFLFGFIKFFIGVAEGRHVEYLFLVLILALGLAIAFVVKRPFLTLRGDDALGRLQAENAALQYAAESRLSDLTDGDLVIALGLFGTGILATSTLSHVLPVLNRPSGWSTSGMGSSSSVGSCGGGGCGAGGGCGGGGCGGGGCGGCGGG